MADSGKYTPRLRLVKSEDDGLFYVGPFPFEHVDYLESHDTLYLSNASPNEGAGSGEWTPEGHVVGFDREGKVSGITLMNVLGTLATGQDVELTIPVPRRYGISGSDIRAAIEANQSQPKD